MYRVRIPIGADDDLVTARAEARRIAVELGFSRTDATLIATAISEIVRNILVHAGDGELLVEALDDGDRQGLKVVARDDGPGIRDLDTALLDGASGRGGFGLGLPGARRLMDVFEVASAPDGGTTVTMEKWRSRSPLERLSAARQRSG